MVSSHNITGMRMDTNSVFKSIDSTKLHHLALNAPWYREYHQPL